MASERTDAKVFAELEARLAPFRRPLPTAAELRGKLSRVGSTDLVRRVDEAFGDEVRGDAIDTEGEGQ